MFWCKKRKNCVDFTLRTRIILCAKAENFMNSHNSKSAVRGLQITPGIAQSLRYNGGETMSADKLYVNGDIFTVNKAQEWAEAVAVEETRIG